MGGNNERGALQNGIVADAEVMPLRSFTPIEKWKFYRCLSF
jgi:hypothetical protein